MAGSERKGEKQRPDPDALLALASKEARGKLTVFLGAAPGVGKTFAMLARAQSLKAASDIVVGLVETHGRAETAGLLEGLEVLPRRTVPYRGQTIEEFDIDAALARKPGIIIVDELAHTNAPESRHPKRYQDVEELIRAGIDVWTAMNIQHLEGLSDVVARITGVAVRETVPDSVLKLADEVIVVDITPAELIQRLKDGKVYVPDNARRAIDGFFKPGTLTALRELALRRTADRVDDQMVDFLRQNVIEGPWATAERLLVCVGPQSSSEKLVRAASRLADGLNAPWTAVHLERAGEELNPRADNARIDETLRLAERLGAETMRVSASDFATEILRIARRENVTQIVLGRSAAGWWSHLRGKCLSDAIMRQASDIGVHIIADEEAEPSSAPRWRLPAFKFGSIAALATVGSVAGAVLIGLGLQLIVKLPNVSMLFMMAVLLCAIYFGRWYAISAAALSFFAYNFFFIPPVYTLTIAEPHEFFALILFLIVAVLAGGLAGRIHDQAETVRKRSASTQALYEFSRKLSGAVKLDDVLWASASHLRNALKADVVLLLPEDGELQVKLSWPPDVTLDGTEMTAARWALDKAEPAGRGSGTLPNLAFQFRPLLTPRGVIGVCGFRQGKATPPLEAGEERELAALLDQTAIALDRALLTRESAKTAALKQSEKLNSALLSSLSHDLRTPLSSIIGAVTTLRQLGEKMSAASHDDLLASIEEEAGRLSRFVSNLLDMTRLEGGALRPKRDWVDVCDVIRAAADRGRKAFPERAIEVSLALDLPLVRGDGALLQQVLFNLIDNANKYGGVDAPTSIFARRDGGDVVISVTDLGKGVPPADLERIFDKFVRRGKVDGRVAGTGLGLSISRGFIEAMGGSIKAESPAVRKRGTRIVIRLPAADANVGERSPP
ncbi:sensor histidine kinase [Methylocella tundrae]|uniref:histidine kinase n=1 Tax=Methylocella tundrae TaxID=227605 RepID=A0A4U8Z2X8_METTU|nr:sensor histidine kinase KdpD [Methylocella tundrae]WPP03588.1 sensor histidine kinase KdpD [Methylocella tundrae]VFU09700.1 Sensor histidine kinase KdpD [Methylocella tundrae]